VPERRSEFGEGSRIPRAGPVRRTPGARRADPGHRFPAHSHRTADRGGHHGPVLAADDPHRPARGSVAPPLDPCAARTTGADRPVGDIDRRQPQRWPLGALGRCPAPVRATGDRLRPGGPRRLRRGRHPAHLPAAAPGPGGDPGADTRRPSPARPGLLPDADRRAPLAVHAQVRRPRLPVRPVGRRSPGDPSAVSGLPRPRPRGVADRTGGRGAERAGEPRRLLPDPPWCARPGGSARAPRRRHTARESLAVHRRARPGPAAVAGRPRRAVQLARADEPPPDHGARPRPRAARRSPPEPRSRPRPRCRARVRQQHTAGPSGERRRAGRPRRPATFRQGLRPRPPPAGRPA
jgi:hypothetical protein